MIVLDTNIVSNVMQDVSEPRVLAWLNALSTESVWTTAITVFEVRLGLCLLPSGKRRRELEEGFTRALDVVLGGKVLSFDQAAGDFAGTLAATAKRTGQNIEVRDVQIAGIVASRRATLATRNVRHFAPLGLTVVNPWA